MLEILLQKQASLGMTESEFAKHLGIKRQTWRLTATGYKRVGETVLSAALAAFKDDEEIEKAGAAYLRELAKTRKHKVGITLKRTHNKDLVGAKAS